MEVSTQLVIFVLLQLLKIGTSLKCYNCVNFECPHQDQARCDQEEEAALAIATNWFQIPRQRATRCPDPKSDAGWEILRSSRTSECAWRHGSCSMMRFEVRTYNLNQVKATEQISYGTILGCDTEKRRELFPVVYTARAPPTRCVFEVKSYRRANSPYVERIFYENCAGSDCNNTNCNTCITDFCTNKEAALPKRFEFQDTETSTRTWAIAMIIFIVILVSLLCMEDLHLLYVPSAGVSKFYYENIATELEKDYREID
ncbi:unnamed protein product [Allacma fusca]|uniref:Sodefrin-like factor n=1 Tax=Allacma fusca TaxID=39272 RepID=A0A8J2JZ41_9HEXA|nr:unnamed protein product [Allacma fusca]